MSSGATSNSTQNRKQYYRPSVTYQLRKRGLDLVQCNGDVYKAINKLTSDASLQGNVLNIQMIAKLRYYPTIELQADEGNLIDRMRSGLFITAQWCYLHRQNIRIYELDNNTRKISEPVIFPGCPRHKTTVGNSDERGPGLFLHSNHFEAVIPLSCNAGQDAYMNDLSIERFVKLCQRGWEDHGNKQQECGICFRKVSLRDSHIIPHSILCMATNEYHLEDGKDSSAKKVTKKLLCGDSSKTAQGCEQMLAGVESELCKFLAGPTWNKKMPPREVDGGLIYRFQEAVKHKTSVQFTVTMNHWHALISIAYRLLITTPQQLPDEQALGRLAKKLHHLTIFPYDDQMVYVWLLLSAEGTKAIGKVGLAATELILWQVVLHGDEKKSVVVHFGIRGLHFIVTDSNGSSVEILTGDEQRLQCTIPVIIDQCIDIPYSHFEKNDKFLQNLLSHYETVISKAALDSSNKESRDNIKESPDIPGNIERLPYGFKYDGGELKIRAEGWEIHHKVNIREIQIDLPYALTAKSLEKKYVCITMWILKHRESKLNIVLAFIDVTQQSEYMVFGYSITSQRKIIGPMFGTRHTGTCVDLIFGNEMTETTELFIGIVFDHIKFNVE